MFPYDIFLYYLLHMPIHFINIKYNDYKNYERGDLMDKLKKKAMEQFATTALFMTKVNVNATCRCLTYQPKMPKGYDKLKRID